MSGGSRAVWHTLRLAGVRRCIRVSIEPMLGVSLSTSVMQDGKTIHEVMSDSYAATISRKDKKRKGGKEGKKKD